MAKFIDMLDNRIIKNGVYVSSSGVKTWYKNGLYHRDGGAPAVEFPNGDRRWYVNGVLHRDDGPAFLDIGKNETWYYHGLFHRFDGPAIIDHKMSYESWFLYDYVVIERDYLNWLNFNGLDINNLTNDDKLFIKVNYPYKDDSF